MNLFTAPDRARLQQRFSLEQFAPAVNHLKHLAHAQMNHPLNVPTEGAGWTHNYTCSQHATRLEYDRDKPHEHACSVDGEIFSGGVYDDAWRAFRNHELIASAHAAAMLWVMSGEQSYLDHAAQVLKAYAECYPAYEVHGKNAGQGRLMGQSLDESVWSIPAAWTYDMIREALPEPEQQLIESQLLHGLGQHLLTQLWTLIHNIQCWHLAGLATLSVALNADEYMQPIFDPQWGFDAQLATGVLDDGWWWEGSPHYHFYTLQALCSLGIAVRERQPDLLARPRFRKMFDAPLEMLRPDMSLPALNDGWIDISYAGGIAQYMMVFERAYGFWQDADHAQIMMHIYEDYAPRTTADALLFGPDILPEHGDLPAENILHAASGYAVLKSRDNQQHLMLKYGPHGGGHGHADKLGLLLWGYGERLSTDLGTPGYGIPMNKSWYRQTLAHNTVLLDQTEQPPQTGQLVRFDTLADGVLVADAGIHWPQADAGLYADVRLRRCILWKESYFIDIVRVICPEPHLIDLAWHHSGTLALDALKPSSLTFDQTGYEHLTQIQETDETEWQAVWQTDAPVGTQMWAFNPAGAQTIAARAPYNPAWQTMSLVLRRIAGAEAVFVSVIESFASDPLIEAVTYHPRDEGFALQVRGDGIDDAWDIHYTPADQAQWKAKARPVYRYLFGN